jgi:hypothetical protein
MSIADLLSFMPDECRKVIRHTEDGVTRVETRQEVSHIIDAAKMLADETPGKDFRHMAYVPKTVLDQAFNEGWFHDKAAWKRWLNAPENQCFRTWKGRA